ncbi:hypothetical protein HYN56_14950 [Flavobacterium crocinum]|uniref:Leucine-rich repeat domain-containing protein n=1 Tax=Flavobacterium crocinum TaxID=2183896 RepID=A0A2S1YN09_9FLAO|nr:hypothetical protein [Flavobacterium crocinum]AWK05465.1 hypothetical protein HYN56_14950 [Flavobacterium crocinum]
MKKITLGLLLLSSFTILFAQAPQKMNYQSVIRKKDSTLLANTIVGIKTSILLGSATGNSSYVETQNIRTSVNGLATMEIGGGNPVLGTFSGIDWGAGPHFIKTEIDPTGGTNYTISGTSQLLSVPYALYAGSSANKGKTSIILTGSITDAEAVEQIKAQIGLYTENVYVTNASNLTTLDLSEAKNLINLIIQDNANLASIKVDNLTEVYGDLEIENNAKLSSLTFPVLKALYGYDTSILNNAALKKISFPLLTTARGIDFSYNASLNSIDIPLLASLHISQSNTVFSHNALPSSQINLILSRLLNVSPSSGKYIDLSQQNPSAVPTGQGILDKATLISRGNSVSTD